MRHVIDSAASTRDGSTGSKIQADVDAVKVIVRVMKKTDLNQKLTVGMCLVQEVETRFGSTYDVLKRFLKAAPHVAPLLSALTERDGMLAFERLSVNEDEQGVESFSSLDAIFL